MGLQPLYLLLPGLFTARGCSCPHPSQHSGLALPAPRGSWHLAHPHRAGQTDISSAWVGRGGESNISVTEAPPCLLASQGTGVTWSWRWLAGPTRVTEGLRAGQPVQEDSNTGQ